MRAFNGVMVGVVSAVLALGAATGCDDGGETGGAGGTGTSSSTGAKGSTTATGTTGNTTSSTTGATTGNTSSSSGGGGAFRCLGDPLPTTAPPMIDLGGSVDGIDGAMMSKVVGATIQLFKGMTLAGTTTSVAMGAFSFMDVPTNSVPVDGSLHATATNYLDTYVFPPYPISVDTPNVRVLMVSQPTLNLLASFGLPTQDPSKGLVGILVVDCDGNNVQGATVTTNPPGQVFYGAGGFPSMSATSTDADGLAYVFNVAPGPTLVDAKSGSNDLREHTIEVHANAVNTTIVAP